ncbi:hypothetical protein ABW19_dt0208991 [Dactylella cylindrospora]|nr:hypothetical protein ABW19_dt0208991 [Dactylella cylindrospora]
MDIHDMGGQRSQDVEKQLRKLIQNGQKFLKKCGSQLQVMSDRGLLNKEGVKTHKHILKYQATNLDSKAIIAFIGESGAGKSTLLNAGQSGIRACTSVATEFGKRGPDMKSKFFAVVEYIQREEFEKEAEILRQDLEQEDETVYGSDDGDMALSLSDQENDCQVANSRIFKRRRLEISDSSNEMAAAVAKDKLKALFPGFQNSDLIQIREKIQKLYQQNGHLAEGRQVIESDDEDTFVEEIHALIANHDHEDEDGLEPQLWPLIKVVK